MNWTQYRNIIQDLETAKWRICQLGLPLHPDLRKGLESGYSTSEFWEEITAYRLSLPRQHGKTTLIVKWAEELAEKDERVVFTAGYRSQLDIIKSRVSDPNKYIFLNKEASFQGFSHAHLFIDEAQEFSKNNLKKILSNNWRSVTLVKA